MKEIRDILAEFRRRRGQPLALATLVRASGSSYRRPGARMLIAADGHTIGALSGGCLEEEVATRALEVIAGGAPLLLHFDTRLRYGCHGAIEIFVEKVRPEFLGALADALDARRSSQVATIYERAGSLGSVHLPPGAAIPAGAFAQTIDPSLQLVLIGEGPDSLALRCFAATLGWETIEREDAATLPDELDEWTAAIVKTHNYGRDYAALARLLPLGLRYVALLGPRRRRDQLLHALQDDRVALRSELFAPAGLDLGAESPEEIALAMVSEIQAVFAEAPVESLRDRKASIHLVTGLAVA